MPAEAVGVLVYKVKGVHVVVGGVAHVEILIACRQQRLQTLVPLV